MMMHQILLQISIMQQLPAGMLVLVLRIFSYPRRC
jgi:hypothetical protein